MNNSQDSIHESGNNLIPDDKQKLECQASSEEDKILRLMRVRKFESFAAFEMADLCRIRKGNARRALSNMSGSSKKHIDEYGNTRLIKREDVRRKDPDTGIRVVTYQYNDDWGVQPIQEQGQLAMFEDEGVMAV